MGLKFLFNPPLTPPELPLPSWVPLSSSTVGNVNLLTKLNNGLSNEFIDTCPANFENYYHQTIINAYSGGVLNPYYGDYGAMIIFGGGHAASNDNSVVAMRYNENNITFSRIIDPSPIYDTEGSLTPAQKKYFNSVGNFNYLSTSTDALGVVRVDGAATYNTIDGKPASCHSYGFLAILPPSGEATHGTFFVPGILAGNYDTTIRTSSITSYLSELTSVSTPPESQAWVRKFTHPTYGNGTTQSTYSSVNSPAHAVYDPIFQRVIYVANNNFPQRWINPSATTASLWFVEGTGTGLSYSDTSPSAQRLLYIPERDIFVFLYRKASDGRLAIKYMINGANPGWNNTPVTLSGNVDLDLDWSAATWCKDSPGGGKILIFDLKNNRSAYVEITIPTPLALTGWTVEQVSLSQEITNFIPAGSRSGDNATIYGRLEYNTKTKSIVYYGMAGLTTATPDKVFVIRPRGV